MQLQTADRTSLIATLEGDKIAISYKDADYALDTFTQEEYDGIIEDGVIASNGKLTINW